MKLQERIFHVRAMQKLLVEEISTLEVRIEMKKRHAAALAGTVQDLLEKEWTVVNGGKK